MADAAGTLPPRWWTDAGLLRQEVEKHGSLAAAGRVHGLNRSTLSVWWRRHGFPQGVSGSLPGSGMKPEGEAVSETEMLTQRVRELESAARESRKEDVMIERVVAAVTSSLAAKKPTYVAPRIVPARGKAKQEFALHWSDAHAGEVVSAEQTNGLETYNWDVMMKRHTRIIESVVSHRDHFGFPVETLHLWALGDMLSGNIHQELAETNEFPIVECAVQFGLDAAEWLEQFLDEFRNIRFAGIVGNHPRLTKKPAAKNKFDNFDWLVYQVMKQRLSRYGDKISWDIPKAQKWPVMIQGRRVLLSHGDGIRSTMVDVPWGGIIRYWNKLSNQYARAGQPLDHMATGHWHQINVVNNRRILINGATKGPDEWSIDTFGGGEKPSQMLSVWHPKHGMTLAAFLDLA